MTRPLREYTVRTRYRSILLYTVEATSKADAKRRFRDEYTSQHEVRDEGDVVLSVTEGDEFSENISDLKKKREAK